MLDKEKERKREREREWRRKEGEIEGLRYNSSSRFIGTSFCVTGRERKENEGRWWRWEWKELKKRKNKERRKGKKYFGEGRNKTYGRDWWGRVLYASMRCCLSFTSFFFWIYNFLSLLLLPSSLPKSLTERTLSCKTWGWMVNLLYFPFHLFFSPLLFFSLVLSLCCLFFSRVTRATLLLLLLLLLLVLLDLWFIFNLSWGSIRKSLFFPIFGIHPIMQCEAMSTRVELENERGRYSK